MSLFFLLDALTRNIVSRKNQKVDPALNNVRRKCGDVTISMLKHIVILSVVSEYERSRRIYSAQINAADNVFADFSTSNG